MSTVQTNFHLTMIQREILFVLHIKGAMSFHKLAHIIKERNKVFLLSTNKIREEIKDLIKNRMLGLARKENTFHLYVTIRTKPIKEEQQ